jgi:hypothetical protein
VLGSLSSVPGQARRVHLARAARPDQPRRGPLPRAERAAIRAAVAARPQLTDEQIDGLCEVIHNARTRRRRATRATGQ